MPIIVTGSFVLDDEQYKEFAAVREKVQQLVKEHEPGCLTYDAHELTKKENGKHQLFFYEVYTDQAAIKKHMSAPGFQLVSKIMKQIGARVDIKVWNKL